MRIRARVWLSVSVLLVGLSATLLYDYVQGRRAELGVVRQVPWSLTGRWLIADTHTHTRFSDGALEPGALAASAAANGCDVLAITDHGDLSTGATTPAYFDAMRAAQQALPALILLPGLEWNIPPYAGREHVSVLLSPDQAERVLPVFRQRFEQDGATAEGALRWLADQVPGPDALVLIYNHPSRKDEDEGENARDMLAWRAVNTLFIGFAGAPGHQKRATVGSYTHWITTRDRWDPVVAEVGGTWDRLLDQGLDVWGALAVSDYHNDTLDYRPCAFSRTHIQVPERSARGVLRGLRAGSFWADVGRVLDALEVTLNAPGFVLPISPGETARVDPAQAVTLSLRLKRSGVLPPGALKIELIGNARTGRPALLSSRTLEAGQTTASWTLTDLRPGADGRSAYFRLRVRRSVTAGPDLMAYTNPIRVWLD